MMITMPFPSTLTASDCSGVQPKKKSCRGMGPMLATPGAMTSGPSTTVTCAVGLDSGTGTDSNQARLNPAAVSISSTRWAIVLTRPFRRGEATIARALLTPERSSGLPRREWPSYQTAVSRHPPR